MIAWFAFELQLTPIVLCRIGHCLLDRVDTTSGQGGASQRYLTM